MRLNSLLRYRTPIAWMNLVADPRKFLWSLLGIAFAVLLMFVQNGFRNSLFDSNVRLIRLLDCDLIVVSSARYNLATEIRFDSKILRRISLLPNLQQVTPLYLERLASPIRVSGKPSRPIRVIAVNPQIEVFRDKALQGSLALLQRPKQVLLDQRSKKEYGFDLKSPEQLQAQHIELANRKIEIAGQIPIGTDFVHDGNLILSAADLGELFPMRNPEGKPLEKIDLGLIRLTNRSQIESVRQAIEELAPETINIFTPEELAARDIRFWGSNTPIGIIFAIGTIMGLAVGTIICYQILYNDISDHLPEFATLKAMGYDRYYFVALVLCQAIYLGCLGFIPGLIATELLFRLLTLFSGLIMELNAVRIFSVFALTLLMCCFSGLLAVRRLWAADPASLF